MLEKKPSKPDPMDLLSSNKKLERAVCKSREWLQSIRRLTVISREGIST